MPIAVPLSSYAHVPETQEALDWADLPTIDLSLNATPEGRAQLAETLIDALRTKGFFYVTNFGISQAEVDSQFAIGDQFYGLPLAEKLQYVPDLENGEYNGYRPAGRRVLSSGVPDRVEVYNIPKPEVPQAFPPLIESHLPEIRGFQEKLHEHVLTPLLTLIATALELPPDALTNLHQWGKRAEDHLRYMKYNRHPAEDYERLEEGDGLYVTGHTDLGTLTLLFRQPVAGLQIRDHDTGAWKWAKPLDASLTVNACDALSFLTGGYVRSTIHRVHVPPRDQRDVDRLGLLYFARPNQGVVLKTLASPVLAREGFTANDFERAGKPAPTIDEFTVAKQTWQQSKSSVFRAKDGQEIVPGFKGQYHD
ncbi:hypothetical protein Q8F55_005996 [Vanrija albida]|uniref:Fe2OG dioxygenase domain-containing protein n=1 Tax=Vanrija albida TaxID=181172 RepID=A0ABR3Q359_9TREE